MTRELPVPGSSPDCPARTADEINFAVHSEGCEVVFVYLVRKFVEGVSACGAALIGRADGAILSRLDGRSVDLSQLSGSYTVAHSNLSYACYDPDRTTLLDCITDDILAVPDGRHAATC